MAPARLHKANAFALLKVGQGLQQKICRRLKISIEDGNEFACGRGKGVGQGASFIANAVRTLNVFYVISALLQLLHPALNEQGGQIG